MTRADSADLSAGHSADLSADRNGRIAQTCQCLMATVPTSADLIPTRHRTRAVKLENGRHRPALSALAGTGNPAIDQRMSAVRAVWPKVLKRVRGGLQNVEWVAFCEEIRADLKAAGFSKTPLRGMGLARWADAMVRHARAGHTDAPSLRQRMGVGL